MKTPKRLNRNKISLWVRKYKPGNPLLSGDGILMIYGDIEDIYATNSEPPKWWISQFSTKDYRVTKQLYDFAGYL